MGVIWRKLPTVLRSDEMLDIAFTRGREVAARVVDRDRTFRLRKQLIRMVQASSDALDERLRSMVDAWPSLDQITDFDRAMVEACVGTDAYRHHLSNLQWAADRIRSIATQNTRKIRRTGRAEIMHQARREAYGRISSLMRRISPSLEWLGASREVLRTLPSVDEASPCIVVCGAPNVGKSALIAALSTGRMEVASYPFTTKQLHVGHFVHRHLPHQLVDTPGLLDRPLQDRNAIELQAIAALEHLGAAVLFVIDPTETCGMSMEDQLHLRSEVIELLSDAPFIEVWSKADLMPPVEGQSSSIASEQAWVEGNREGPAPELLRNPEGTILISTVVPFGLESLRGHLIEMVAGYRTTDRMALPLAWPRREG